jgi:hypothetical protein
LVRSTHHKTPHAVNKKQKKAAVVANAILHKQGSLQWFKFIKRLEFSAGQSPE